MREKNFDLDVGLSRSVTRSLPRTVPRSLSCKLQQSNSKTLRNTQLRFSFMGQRSLIYAFVSRGTVILAEYTEFSGNFNSIAFQCLQKLPATNNKFTYNCDGHTFNYLVDNGYSMSFFCVFFFSQFL